MTLKNTPLNTSNRFDPEDVQIAEEKTSASFLDTFVISDSDVTVYTSSAKGASLAPTGPSLLLSDPNIPKSTYESSSQRTTGARSSTSNAIPSGPRKSDSLGQSEKSSLQPGYPEFKSLPYVEMTEHNHSSWTKQVGGSHYKDFVIQPAQFIHKNGIGFLEGNVIKYVCRYKSKNGIEDLKKARHYIDLLIDAETP